MKTLLAVPVLLFAFFYSPAQKFHVGITGGLVNYSGDLPDKIYVDKQAKKFIGATLHYELAKQIFLRAGISIGEIAGSDKFSSKAYLEKRNLSFESTISEVSVVGEFFLFNLEAERLSPYIFTGFGIFHFDPYTYDADNRQLYLRPLSTEGQGIYPDRKKYSLTQLAIPVGGGLKISISENIMLGIEVGFRKLFTDYLDDVSTTYADYNDLLAARGVDAVNISYREDEIPDGNPAYPVKGTQRGGALKNDAYYFTGINLTYRLGNRNKPYRFSLKKNRYGCPSSPW